MKPLWITSSLALLFLAGCGEQSTLEPRSASLGSVQFAAPALPGRATLDAYWPNEDGRSWEYDYRFETCGVPTIPSYATTEEVPNAPPIEDVIPLLGLGRLPKVILGTATPCPAYEGKYKLKFDGQITTLSGVTAQNLIESLMETAPIVRNPKQQGGQSAFLARLGQVRPDLRRALAQTGYGEEVTSLRSMPLLVHGYAWEKTADHIGTYGDVDQLLAWKFLDQNIRPGSAFTQQLVPSLADDVFLHALVLPRNQQSKLHGLNKEIQVVYLVDYGTVAATDSSAEITGYYRPIDYGVVVYARGIGPVSDLERRGGSSGDPGSANEILKIELAHTSLPSIAVR